MDKTPTSTHDLSVWSSSSLGRWHPRSSVLLVLTRHSSPILNEQWTRVINLSMFFLLCYDLTTILRSRALHWVLSLVIQYTWCSYMLSRLYRKVKTFRSDLLTYYFCPQTKEHKLQYRYLHQFESFKLFSHVDWEYWSSQHLHVQ
jgi:hypothetical protein